MPENISKFVCATKVCISICPKLSSIWFPFENHRKKRNCSRIRMVISVFLLPNFFLHFWKNTQTCIFSKVNKTNLATKKTKKKTFKSLENCTNSDAGILNLHFSLLFIIYIKLPTKITWRSYDSLTPWIASLCLPSPMSWHPANKMTKTTNFPSRSPKWSNWVENWSKVRISRGDNAHKISAL